MRENHPIAATVAEALPGGPPTVSPPARRGVAGHSVAVSPTRDCCDLCGAAADTMHFFAGRLWCLECWQGREPAASMPPTKSQAAQLSLWIRGAP
jgi:hypothetical protein